MAPSTPRTARNGRGRVEAPPPHLEALLRAWAANAAVPLVESRASVRPRLRADVISFSGASGAVLKSDSGTTLLPGCAAFELLQTLAPRLTGDHTVRALGAGLDPAAAAALGSFVGFLIERGLADDARPSRGRTKPDAAHRLFAPELELLHRLVDQPFEQFERFRRADVLIVGQGVSFATCSAALIRGGLAVLRACPLDGDGDLAEARAMAEQSRAAGAPASVEIVEAIEDLTPAAHQLAIYCSDAPILARIAALNRVCCAQRRELLVGCMLDDVGVCGPLIESVSGGCWLCAVVRVVKDLPERARRAVYALCERTSTGTATPNRALARIVGQDVAFEAFKILAGSRRLQTVNEAIVYASEPAVPCMLTRVPTTLSACLNYCAPVSA